MSANMQVKKWYESKLIWLGGVEIITAVILESANATSTWQSIALAGLGALTITLRAVTSTSIGK